MKGHRKRYGARLNNGGDNPSWSMSVLPYVLISDILAQLPMQKILQCRCICKIWYNLLIGQDSDVLQSAKVRDTLVFRTPTEKGQSDIYLFELEPGLEQVMKFNYTKASLPNRSRLALVGSCNGLLCLYDLDSMKSLYVVNPMTGEYVQTPPKLNKERRHAGTLVDAVHGFGFSPVTNQYKVIRVFEKVLSHPNVHHESLGEIFTLGTNKWRSIGKTPFPANKEFFGVPLNGAIHWIANNEFPSSELICAFDIDSEKVRTISPPPDFHDYNPEGMMLGVLGGFLYICNNYAGLDFIIWLMKIYGVEESWTSKEIVIARNSPKPDFRTIRPMMILKDGNVLILRDDETLELYDPRRKEFGNIAIKGVSSIL